MKTYKEYYKEAEIEENQWYYDQLTEWWKDDIKWINKELCTKGDYLETSSFISIDEKNNSSICENHTNIKNREISILFSMLRNIVIEWCDENNEHDDIWDFSIEIKRELDGLNDILLYRTKLKGLDYKTNCWFVIEDEDKIEKFNDCAGFLCDIINEFISIHKKDIPCDWNTITFNLDGLPQGADSSFFVSCFFNKDYDNYINCL